MLPGVRDQEDLKRILGFVNAPQQEKDYSVLGTFVPKEVDGTCVYCSHCQPCPAALDKKAGDCIHCGHCDSRCPFHVRQGERMDRIQEYFGE